MKIIATNKKAFHQYHLQDKVECGLMLVGPEVKSLRAGGVSFTDSFARAERDGLILYNMHISPYNQASYNNVDPMRPRTLLVHKKEMERLQGALSREGLTLVPTKIYFNARGFVKVEIALAKGKKLYDKREDIKTREVSRQIDRRLRQSK